MDYLAPPEIKLRFALLQDVLFQWLTTSDIHLNQMDAEDPEVSEICCKEVKNSVIQQDPFWQTMYLAQNGYQLDGCCCCCRPFIQGPRLSRQMGWA